MTTTTDPRIRAIRADELVGEHTCSSIDECYTDAEILAALESARILEASGAVRWARELERVWFERLEDTYADADVECPIARLGREADVDALSEWFPGD